MGRLYGPVAERQRAAAYGLHLQKLQRGAASRYVHDGIGGSDLVEGDFLGGYAVDRAFGFGEAFEGGYRAADGAFGEVRAVYQVRDVAEGAVGVSFGVRDADAEGSHAAYLGGLGGDLERHPQRAQHVRDLC